LGREERTKVGGRGRTYTCLSVPITTPEHRGNLSEIGFYHLTRSDLLQALPQLLARTLAAGQRALVLCGSPDRVTALDQALWQASDPWLPHGTAADGDADLQPIWLATDDTAPNRARFLFLVDGAAARLEAFDRVFDLFDGNDPPAVQAARQRWTAAKAAGHTLAYWQQGVRGWEKKA
jgi:DNA polymerase-3 subunit chi